MLTQETKRKIDSARDILVGKVPDPKAQVEQITTALIYKFMDDMDKKSVSLPKGKAQFFTNGFEKYAWPKLMDPRLGGHERLELYVEALTKMSQNPHLPQLFRDIFKDTFLPYRNPETLTMFLKEINGFTYDHSEDLGDAFEYLLSVLGSQGDAGQFRTPRHIIDFIVSAVDPSKDDTICDPACGTAGFLISAYKHILRQHDSKDDPEQKEKPLTPDQRKKLMGHFVGYDISPDMVRLSKVNMYLHGFPNPTIFEYDTLSSEEKWDESFDVMLANPPFMSPKGGIKPHKRFSVKANRSEVLFVDYILEHLRPNGRAGIIVPEGIVFQSATAYKTIRKLLVIDGLIAVISLPAGVFNPYSGVKTCILLFDNALSKRSDILLFLKIRNDGYDLGAQRREIAKNDLPEALQILRGFKTALIDSRVFNLRDEDVSIATVMTKSKILATDDCILSGDRYRVNIDAVNQKWETVELASVTRLFADGDWIESKDQSENGIRLIQTGNVGLVQYLDKGEKARFISNETFDRLQCTEVSPGDILISRLPDPVGRACMLPKLDARMITAVDCTIVRFDEQRILPMFFLYFSKSRRYFAEIAQYLTGASRQRISRSNLGKVKIPLPPLDVQKEIVERIEVKQRAIDAAQRVIESIESERRYFGQVLSKLACEWIELGSLCKFVRGPFGGSLKREIFKPNGYLVYEQYHAINNDFSFGRYYIDEQKFAEMKRFEVHTGDLIISCSGTMGKIAIIPANHKQGIINQALLKLTPNSTLINNLYLKLALESDFIQSRYFRDQSGSSIQNVASVKELQTMKVPLPSLDIQNGIIAAAERENEIVEPNRRLINLYEGKIAEVLSEI